MTATACIQPIDMIKVRLQLAGEGVRTGPKPSALGITKDIIAQGKVMDLYTGISAGLLRQAVYTTARLGFFDTFQNTLSARAEKKGTKITFLERAAAGLTAGGLAAMVGNPADLALIRMQSDGLKPKDKRANYRSVFDALKRIAGAEGIGALWAGAYPNSGPSDGPQLRPIDILCRIEVTVSATGSRSIGNDQDVWCLCHRWFLCVIL